tara:strand:+ start:1002 stop:1988 length:987 start_codon:yes stop_codon:yes gene_type:complete
MAPSSSSPFTALIVILSALAYNGLHTVKQGHRGLYIRGGRLLDGVTEPGFNVKMPFTRHHDVQVTVQTDKLMDIPCVSSQGGTAYLNIEVVNRLTNTKQCVLKAVSEFGLNYDQPLIFDYVPSEVAQFCKDHTLEAIYISEFDKLDELLASKLKSNVDSYGMNKCLDILRVRIHRPRLSPELAKRFEAIEHEVKERQLQEKLVETERVKLAGDIQRAKMHKSKEQEEMRIEMETAREKQKLQAEIAALKAASELNTVSVQAEAKCLQDKRRAEGLRYLINAFRTNNSSGVLAFVEHERVQAFWNSTNKVYYFGDSAGHLPQTYLTPGQ